MRIKVVIESSVDFANVKRFFDFVQNAPTVDKNICAFSLKI